MKHLLATISAFGQAYLLFPFVAHAATTTGQAQTGLSGATTSLTTTGQAAYGMNAATANLPTIIGQLISVVLGFMGIFLVVYIVWAGYIYSSSAGEKEKIDKAKKMISSAVIGLILIVAAYAISSYVISAIITASGAA